MGNYCTQCPEIRNRSSTLKMEATNSYETCGMNRQTTRHHISKAVFRIMYVYLFIKEKQIVRTN
jgi:hypothetical protein